MYNTYKPKRSLAPNVIKANLEDIPWAEAEEYYTLAANTAAELSISAHRNEQDRQYKYKIQKLKEAWELSNPEEGSYEGNLEDEHPQPAYSQPPDLVKIRRAAGQKAVIDQFIKHRNMGTFMPKVLPKLIDLIGSWHVTRNASGLVSGLQFCKDHFNTKERMGMFRVLTLNSKSDFLEKQYKGDGRHYCALVPIIMYAIRKSKNIKYSEWDRSEITYVMHSKLADAMLWEGEVPDRDTLLRDREVGLTYQSGAKAGTNRDPVSTYRLYSTTGTCYEGMPEYVQVMYSQIWCAHPSNRTKYMILDPMDWDNVPLPLVNIEVTTHTSVTDSIPYDDSNPWL